MQKRDDRGIAITTVRGVVKYCANITLPDKRRKKAYFNTKEEARSWLKQYKMSLGVDLSDLATLSKNQLADIRKAIEILPVGHSLTEIVSEYNKTIAETKISLSNAWEEYQEHKKVLNSGKKPKFRITHFFEDFPTWQDASNVKAVLEWLKERGAPKTIKEYRAELKQFFDYADRRGYWHKSPIDRISGADLPKIKRAYIPVWTIDDIKFFFDWLEAERPHRVLWFAIACFTGIRRAEINRLKPEYFDLKNRRITLPYHSTKTGDTWLMEDLTNNFWAFVESYGLKSLSPICDSRFTVLTNDFEAYCRANGRNFKWGHNICRHSFCTYHLSLYRNPVQTALLLRHRNPAQMWQHYLAGLTTKDIASDYFSIEPKLRSTK